MGEVNLDKAEVTLLSRGKKRIKRLDGSYAEAITLETFCRVTLSDGTQYFAELRVVPRDIYQSGTVGADQFVYEHFFLEAHGVEDKGDGFVVHDKRGHI